MASMSIGHPRGQCLQNETVVRPFSLLLLEVDRHHVETRRTALALSTCTNKILSISRMLR